MVQVPFSQRIYSPVVEHTLNPDSTHCVGTGEIKELKIQSYYSFRLIPRCTHLSTLFQSQFLVRSTGINQRKRAKQIHPLTHPNLNQPANVGTISMTRL